MEPHAGDAQALHHARDLALVQGGVEDAQLVNERVGGGAAVAVRPDVELAAGVRLPRILDMSHRAAVSEEADAVLAVPRGGDMVPLASLPRGDGPGDVLAGDAAQVNTQRVAQEPLPEVEAVLGLIVEVQIVGQEAVILAIRAGPAGLNPHADGAARFEQIPLSRKGEDTRTVGYQSLTALSEREGQSLRGRLSDAYLRGQAAIEVSTEDQPGPFRCPGSFRRSQG